MVALLSVMWLSQPGFLNLPGDSAAAIEMVEDVVAEHLRQFRAERDPRKRVTLIERFGRIRDPRVTVALMEVVLQETQESRLLWVASSTVVYHHIPREHWGTAKYWAVARIWWINNEAKVRRRAARLSK